MSKTYKLSKTLFGHSLDVRSVYVTPDNAIISGSRDKTAKLWMHDKLRDTFGEAMTYRDQKNFVISVLYLESCNEFPDGVIITGSNDFVIYLYKPSEPFATKTIKKHTNAVSCLGKGLLPMTFLSGSWDCTAKLWNLNNLSEPQATFTGHTAAVWDVAQLQDSRVITASADKTIKLWSNEGQLINTLMGHTDCVRGLLDLIDSKCFVSVSNDASIKIWTYSGENTDTYYGHSNYIYSITRCAAAGTTCFVTSDEDRTVRVWKNGINTDTFQLPAQSVWSVACLSNGDIVTGSSDGVVRIFTQNENRFADEAALTKYEEEVEALTRQSTQQIGGYKVADLPGQEALYDPGKKPGQMKMIREDNKVVAYTWVEQEGNNHWEKVGDVLGSTNENQGEKTMFEGKPYDYVFSVDVEDGKPPLKLPFNKNDDPYTAAHEFLAKNFLPPAYLDQVVEFILKNTKEHQAPTVNTEYVDPFTGGSRYTPNAGGVNQVSSTNPDPFTGDTSYTTLAQSGVIKYFPYTTYRLFDMGDVNVILNKLKEFRRKRGDDINENQLEQLVKLCEGPPTDPNSFDVLFRLLDWSDDMVLPVLDVIRLAVRHQKNNEVIVASNNGILIQRLLYFANGENKYPNNIIVALRALCNLFSHEPGENLIFDNRFDIAENITTFSTLNKNGQIALATLLLNLTIVVLRRKDELGISILADVLLDVLTKLTEPEAQFRAYVALGTLLTSAGTSHGLEIKAKVKSNSEFLKALQLTLYTSTENKNRECANELQALLNRS